MNEKKKYIERGALIDSFEDCYYLYNSTDREIVRQAIENAPDADVAPAVHGEWEDKQNPRWKAYDIRHCSVCGWNITKTKLRNKDLHWNYCPNCGAKMDGGKHALNNC